MVRAASPLAAPEPPLLCRYDALSCVVADHVHAAQQHPFGSFAPVRHSNGARWFVDGAAYFAALEDTLRAAQHEIMVTGWMISPELVLGPRRPDASLEEQAAQLLRPERA